MAKQGENIYQRKDGRWEGKYIRGRSASGIQYGYLAGKSYEEVFQRKREKLQELEEKRRLGTADSLSVSSLSDMWLKSRRGILKETTLGKYDAILKNYIIPQYGDRQISGISGDEIQLWLEGLAVSGGQDEGGISARSANGIASVLRLVFRYARICCNAHAPELSDIHMKQPRNQVEILSHSEQNLLEEYLMENLDPGSLGIMSSLYTGIRLGEVCALRWGSVHQEDGVLDIHATMSRIKTYDPLHKTKIIITSPKSACSVRQIPIPSGFQGIMESMRMGDDCFLLTGSSTDHMDPRTLQNRFKAALENCGIAPVRFHALRHTFATRCIELGFDVKSLSEILGHANITVTMNRYVHPTIVMKKDYMDRFSLAFVQNPNENQAK